MTDLIRPYPTAKLHVKVPADARGKYLSLCGKWWYWCKEESRSNERIDEYAMDICNNCYRIWVKDRVLR